MKKLMYSILSIMIVTGCSKPKDGKDGATGPAGNANVQTVTITNANWVHFGTVGQAGDGYEATLNCPNITSSIVSTGAVMVYFSNNLSTWVALPYSAPYATWHRDWTFAYQQGQVFADCQDSDFNTTQPTGLNFKVVAIASSVRIANPNLNWNDYESVKKALHLSE